MYAENFVVARSLYPLITKRAVKTQLTASDPTSGRERDYRDLLNEANLNYFHREYTIALQNYVELQAKILEQSHPELPKVGGVGSVLGGVSLGIIDHRRLLEMGRRILIDTNPGDPIEMKGGKARDILPGEFRINAEIAKLGGLGLDTKVAVRDQIEGLRVQARRAAAEDRLESALQFYEGAAKLADTTSDVRLLAGVVTEMASVRATYAKGPQRMEQLKIAGEEFRSAIGLFERAGDPVAATSLRTNIENIEKDVRAPPIPILPDRDAPIGRPPVGGGSNDAISSGPIGAHALRIPPLQSTRSYVTFDRGAWVPVASTIASVGAVPPGASRKVGIFVRGAPVELSLDAGQYENTLVNAIYQPRVTASDLASLDFHESVETNFAAYLVHLYYFVLPISIGDTYLAMGRYQNAIDSYRAVLAYPFLNAGIESSYVWMKLARAWLAWGSALYRSDQPIQAMAKYEEIIRTDLTIPASGSLYQHALLQPMITTVEEVVKEIRQEPHGAVNPQVATIVMEAHVRLSGIAANLNFLGLAPDYVPIFRFRYLQGIATYMADNAIQAERTFVSFRSGAENQTIERMQLESSIEVNRAALEIEKRRVDELALEVKAAEQTRAYSQLRSQHAVETLDEWNTKGWELATMNAALAWASNAANDQDINYTGVHYNGSSHDYSGDVEDFFDTVGETREWYNWEMQRDRLARQRDEAAAEVAIAQTRAQQARVRADVQNLNVALAQKRYDASKEILAFAETRTFTEDLWFQLANSLEDLARFYLDAAVYAAFLMERAYAVEFDRELHLIRFDYGVGGPNNLLGGDYLKADIVAFTNDMLQNARKKSPIRHVFSLREEFPAEFNAFATTGVLNFRTDLEIFDRRYCGTYRRKIKRIELFAEGLLPLEGAVGTLTNEGVTTEWREAPGGWVKQARVSPVERMVLSSYQFRRDLSVFQPSEEMLELFENKSVQANWTLELPKSGNNIDYQAVTDVKFAIYFDGEYSDSLAQHVKTFYANTGGRSMLLSARFDYPDEYFRFDTNRNITFRVAENRFRYNHEAPQMTSFAVRLMPRNGGTVDGVGLQVRRVSDGSVVNVTTDASGAVVGDPATMAPFAAWRLASPKDAFEVSLADGVPTNAIGDVHLSIGYGFTYRADA